MRTRPRFATKRDGDAPSSAIPVSSRFSRNGRNDRRVLRDTQAAPPTREFELASETQESSRRSTISMSRYNGKRRQARLKSNNKRRPFSINSELVGNGPLNLICLHGSVIRALSGRIERRKNSEERPRFRTTLSLLPVTKSKSL